MPNHQAQRETQRHRAAFEAWYSADRSFAIACQSLRAAGRPVPERTLRDWAERYGWHDRAADRDAEAEALAHRESVRRQAALLSKHAKIGEGLVNKAANAWAEMPLKDAKVSEIIAAIKLGIEIERRSQGLPEWVISLLGKDDSELITEYGSIVAAIGTSNRGDEAARDRLTDPDAEGAGDSEGTTADD